MSLQTDIFNNAIDHFGAEQEEIRTAAAFAAGSSTVFFWPSISMLTRCHAGNMAIGNLNLFLPAILKLVQSDAKKRLLSLHALKEVCQAVNIIKRSGHLFLY